MAAIDDPLRGCPTDRFLDALRQTGLVPADRLDAQLRRSAAEGPPEDGRELAARFVRDGLLTPYQADQLVSGQGHSLVIAGKYAILTLLAAGGMGQVYLAEHLLMRRRSAVKILPARLTADPAAVERFHREARAVAALDHPNIVRAYDVDSADDLQFLVMEYVDGVSLQDLVARRGPLEPAAAADYIAQAARGLQHAHENGWVHRDVKPANLLLDRSGTVKVLDLGLARMLGDDVELLTGSGDPSVLLGTADYLAPEQATDSHAADIRSDVYSLGATLYFLLTGRPPFAEGTPAQRVLAHQTRPPKPVIELRPEVPAVLAAVLDRMLAKDPVQRYLDPAAVDAALGPWAVGGPFPPPADAVSAATGGRAGPQSSWARQAGLSSTRPTPAPLYRRAAPGETAHVTVGAAETTAPPSRPEPARRRWPIGAAAVVAVGITVWAGVVFWPRQPQPQPAVFPAEEPVGIVRTFEGHTGAIENVAFSPDGSRLVTVSQDKTARVWDVATGGPLVKFTGHTDVVRGLAVLPDGHRVATAGWAGNVRLWNLETGTELRRFEGHDGEVWSVACDAAGKHLLTAGKDKTVRLWDVDTGREVKEFLGHRGLVTAAVFLPDGRRIVSASVDRTVRLWDLRTGKVTNGLALAKPVYRLNLCANNRRLLFGCDRELFRWDPDAKWHHTPIESDEAVEGAVCLPDGRLVLAMIDGSIRVWEPNMVREALKFPGNGKAVLAVAVAPDGRHVASGGRDRVAHLWRLP
jgi:serine/threonine protein kinase